MGLYTEQLEAIIRTDFANLLSLHLITFIVSFSLVEKSSSAHYKTASPYDVRPTNLKGCHSNMLIFICGSHNKPPLTWVSPP